jgi:hypothetical protein
MKILIINTHLTYQGWSEGKLNFTFMEIAKTFFVERGDAVAETFIERGYDPAEEVAKHVEADPRATMTIKIPIIIVDALHHLNREPVL